MTESTVSEKVLVLNETGIHARPANFIVGLIKKVPCSVTLKKGDETANAKSLIEILSLSLAKGDEVEIAVQGEQATEVLSKLVDAFKSGLGEEVAAGGSAKEEAQPGSNATQASQVKNLNEALLKRIANKEPEIILEGLGIYPSTVIGRTFLLHEENLEVQENSTLSIDQEKERLRNVINLVKETLNSYIGDAKKQNKVSQVEIFSAHLEVLSDDFLMKAIDSALQNGKTAEFAVKEATQKTCNVLLNTENVLLQERVADIKDIERHLLFALLGKEIKSLDFPEDSIIIAEDLTPSKITSFNSNVKGVVLAKGSTTAHISIMMKNEGIPSMVAVGEEILSVENGTQVVLISSEGKLILNPKEELCNKIKDEVVKINALREHNLKYAKEPAVTTDNVHIKLLGNVGGLAQAQKAYEKGAEGIGLVRSEFLFMNSSQVPTEEDQYKVYQSICDAMHGGEVIVRTLDVGGDKPIAYMNLPKEENPIMGLRGVRNYSLNQEIVDSQIRALLRVNPTGTCKIMIPMVSTIDEVKNIKELILDKAASLNITQKIQIGIMVEVPSVALLAEQFAEHVDFFSIGTNDLAQYILAMDRGHNVLAKYLSNFNPALLKAIKFACDGAKKHHVEVGVCGAMASEIECVPLLIGLGVKDLAVSAELIPDIKALIRNISFEFCAKVAAEALTKNSDIEVKDLVKREFKGLL